MCKYLRSFFLLAGLAVMTAMVSAQDPKTVDVANKQRPPVEEPIPDDRGEMLRMLGLSPDQMRQIRRINMERNPQLNAAVERQRMANQALDAAIYAEQANEADVQARLRELHAAHGEVLRNRFMKEFAIRRLLTPDQLVKFRRMRERFERAREDAVRKNNKQNQRGPGRNPLRNNVKPIR